MLFLGTGFTARSLAWRASGLFFVSSCLPFLHYEAGLLVFSQSDKAGVAKMIGGRPPKESKLRNGLGAKPDAVLHFGGRQPMAPAAGTRFGEIHKRAFFALKRLQLRMDLATGRGNKARPHAGTKVEIISSIEADYDSVESMCPRCVSTDHKLLREFNAHLDPCPIFSSQVELTTSQVVRNAADANCPLSLNSLAYDFCVWCGKPSYADHHWRFPL